MTRVPLYNQSDDYFYLNGTKLPYRGYQNAIPIFANGQFGVSVGAYTNLRPYSGYTVTGNFEIGANLTFNVDAMTPASCCQFITDDAIDFTNYETIKFTVDGSEYSIDVRNINVLGYIVVEAQRENNYVGDVNVSVIPNKVDQYMNGYLVTYTGGVVVGSTGTHTISSVILE